MIEYGAPWHNYRMSPTFSRVTRLSNNCDKMFTERVQKGHYGYTRFGLVRHKSETNLALCATRPKRTWPCVPQGQYGIVPGGPKAI